MIQNETIRLMEVQWLGTWARRYYALQCPAGRREEVGSIVTSGTCLEGAVLNQIGLPFGRLCEGPTGRAFSSRAKGLRMYDRYRWSGSTCFVVVIVIAVVVVIRRRS